jgi:AraC-like DNA-binding protein
MWQVDRIASYRQEYIVPKGIVEIIFNFSDDSPIQARFGNEKHTLSKCFINAFNTIPIEISLPRKQIFFGIRLQPLAAKKVLKVPASEFANLPVDVTLLDDAFSSLWHQLADAGNFNSRVSLFCRWVEQKLFDWHPQEKLMNEFLCSVGQHDFTVEKLADALCYSPRHLSRKLLEATGMNTEETLLYKKYLHALDLMHHSDMMLTEIAHRSYFSDQAHFTKSFKTLTRLTPGEYRRKKANVKGHLFENVR